MIYYFSDIKLNYQNISLATLALLAYISYLGYLAICYNFIFNYSCALLSKGNLGAPNEHFDFLFYLLDMQHAFIICKIVVKLHEETRDTLSLVAYHILSDTERVD